PSVHPFPTRRSSDLNERDFALAVRELRRVLVRGGRLLLTVPYGRPRQLGWLQVFDRGKVEQVIEEFGGSVVQQAYYRYCERGWQDRKSTRLNSSHVS